MFDFLLFAPFDLALSPFSFISISESSFGPCQTSNFTPRCPSSERDYEAKLSHITLAHTVERCSPGMCRNVGLLASFPGAFAPWREILL